jgi:N-acetylmuramoyl-L-alanine amidase
MAPRLRPCSLRGRFGMSCSGIMPLQAVGEALRGCMRKIVLLTILAFLGLTAGSGAADKVLTVKGVRYSTYATFTRIVVEVEAAAPYVLTRSRDGKSVMLGPYEGSLIIKAPLPAVHDGVVAGIETAEEAGRIFLVVRLAGASVEAKDFSLRSPDRIVIDIMKGTVAAAAARPQEQAAVVVLDPGHGGRDEGLVAGQVVEKTFDLELALAVGKILGKSGRPKVVVTRQKDQALTLNERAASANAAGATVFVSIHGAPGAGARVFIQEPADDAEEAAPDLPANEDFLVYETGSERREMAWNRQQAPHGQQSGELGRKLARRLAGSESAEPVQAALAGFRAVDAAAVLIEVGMGQDLEPRAREIAAGIEQYVTDIR